MKRKLITPKLATEVLDFTIHLFNSGIHGQKSFIFNESMRYFENDNFDSINSPLVSALTEAEDLTGYLLYSNDPPKAINYGKYIAHSKGILFWNNKYIWWVIHSVPNWPETLKPLSKMENSMSLYGQSMIVIKLSIFSKESILSQLITQKVGVYASFNCKFAKRKLILSNVSSIEIGTSIPNTEIRHFSKSDLWSKDIFDDLICSSLNICLKVQSWGRPIMKDTLLSSNIKKIRWENGEQYKSSQDHSKWAVSSNINNPWIFISDLNRMKSQFNRGGGILAIKNEQIWRIFNSIIIE